MSSDRIVKDSLARVFIIAALILTITSIVYPEDPYLFWTGGSLAVLGFIKAILVQPRNAEQARKRKVGIVFLVVFLNFFVGLWLFW